MVGKMRGFTIVEILIVIVVIGLLAAITLVVFNGVKQRAAVASATADLRGIAQRIRTYSVINGDIPPPSTTIQSIPDAKIKVSDTNTSIGLIAYCAGKNNFAVSMMAADNNIYHVTNTKTAFMDNSIQVGQACVNQGIINADGSAASVVYPGMSSTACASESGNGTCTFSGVKSVAFGGGTRFYARAGLSGSVQCSLGVFGDPYGGFVKSCYVVDFSTM